MKKIMFNDKNGLTQAVLEGIKTQTRRIMNPQPEDCSTVHRWYVVIRFQVCIFDILNTAILTGKNALAVL